MATASAWPKRLAGGWRGVRRRLRGSALAPTGGHWLHIRIDGAPDELGVSGLSGGAPKPALLDWLRVFDHAAHDPRVAGIWLELRGEGRSPSAGAALRRAIDAFRAEGKRVVAWLDGPGLMQYALAARCDEILAPESARLNLLGLRSEQLYFKDFLDSIDVRPDVVHVGRYKTAAEPATRRGMSDPQREQIGALQDTVFESLVAAIAEGRGLDTARVHDLVDEALFPARVALDAGLIDACCYADQVEARLTPGRDRPGRRAVRETRVVEGARYLALDVRAWDGTTGPYGRAVDIAYWVLAGSIGSGPRSGISLDAFRRTAEALRTDPAVRAVVLRIDSPGGDALASDLMHRELVRLREEKPVVASLADVAASGGYYLAAAAEEIHAEDASITGSIGVVGGKLDLSKLYERLGIVKETVERGARSGLFSEDRGFSPPERRLLRRELGAIYDIFLRRVADGRRLDRAAVERIAEGRVWSGARALEIGLVDRLGGPLEATRRAHRRAGLHDLERPRFRVLPQIMPWERLTGWLTGS